MTVIERVFRKLFNSATAKSGAESEGARAELEKRDRIFREVMSRGRSGIYVGGIRLPNIDPENDLTMKSIIAGIEAKKAAEADSHDLDDHKGQPIAPAPM